MSSKVGFKYRLAAIVINAGSLGLGVVGKRQVRAASIFVADCLSSRNSTARGSTVTKVPYISSKSELTIDQIMYGAAIEMTKSAVAKIDEYGDFVGFSDRIFNWNGKNGVVADVNGPLRDFAAALETFVSMGCHPENSKKEVLALSNFAIESHGIRNKLSIEAIRGECPFKGLEEVESYITYLRDGVKLMKDFLEKV